MEPSGGNLSSLFTVWRNPIMPNLPFRLTIYHSPFFVSILNLCYVHAFQFISFSLTLFVLQRIQGVWCNLMSLSYVGFPSKEDHGDKKNMDAMVEDTADSGTDFGINKEKSYFGLWPMEHPIEPDPHQDRPVNCPLPHSSFIKEERVRFGTRRKRHHSLHHDQDHIKINPLLKGPLPPQCDKMYQMH